MAVGHLLFDSLPVLVTVPGFAFAGFDLVDVQGAISALTNCGGFDRHF
jgi:hypothetical protein